METLLSSVDELSAKKIFDAFSRAAKRSLGQNFLFDEKINRKIVSVAGDLTGKTITEIGPGPGGLTMEILRHPIKKMYVIEFDRHWSDVWRNLSRLFDGKLEVIEQDALKFDFGSIAPNVIISNLPYNISTQLLLKLLKEFDRYERLVLMFQKEVADRLYAVPSTKSYGRLSVLSQWKSRVEKAFDLEPGSFFPPPKVRSTVVKFTPYPRNQSFDNFNLFSDLLTAAFTHRRKNVVKSLSKFCIDAKQILQELGYGPNTRAEEISVENYTKFIHIFEAIYT
ncbi:MAG: 16S rRNA (adenine(1518)-N(6)/adenine(1519)-N(6))-dimethyltransferase RsmA [Holosporaceae bacterium]|jgi:16S rRNA (adenine1518-N6/adenine1519-N6)-dimethyltransferase|nr:16S rRNA (adenine(1518)-N(6)/adenine(1519)-N(6))-dimethyltransferase RsmA [Holosporaceae bacterium]